MTTPLNPRLYEQLKRAFGDVKTAKEGQPFQGYVKKDAVTGKHSIVWQERGESYQVCCPFCGDTRYRLWFQHRWGTKLHGFEFRNAAKCYNEDCQERPDFYPKVSDMLAGYIAAPKPLEAAAPAPMTDIALPGTCVPINTLPADHFICGYLRERGYDIDDLATNWDIRWRLDGSMLGYTYRLVIPAYVGTPDARRLGGWQVRYFDPYTHGPKPPSKTIPKYISATGMKKSRMLYNEWQLGQHGVVVVCEGPLDVIKVGPHGVGIFGKDASVVQVSALLDTWEQVRAPVVVLLDNTADTEALALVSKLRDRGCLATRLYVPHGKDPGDCTREELADIVAAGILDLAARAAETPAAQN